MEKFYKAIKYPFSRLGPGFITGAADDDPAGIATYSQTGAQVGLKLLWLAPITFPLMSIVQEMCARIGIVTGQGLAANIRKVFPRPIVILLTTLLLIANTINIGANLGAMAAAVLLLVPSLNFTLVLLAIALLSLLLQIILPYHTYAQYLKWLAFVLVFYALSALATPNIDWNEVLTHTLIPTMPTGDTVIIIAAILGTTISPYLFFWQTSQEVEESIDNGASSIKARMKSVTSGGMKAMRIDVWSGMFFSNLIMFFIILATALTLHKANITNIETAGDAAEALRPFLGDFAYLAFTVGIIGTGLLAVPVLAGSSAYAVSEGLKKKEGLSRKWYQASTFYGVIVISMIVGVGTNFMGINPIQLLIASAVVNALVAPFVLAAIVLLSQNHAVMGKYKNNILTTMLGWGVTGIMAIAGLGVVISLL